MNALFCIYKNVYLNPWAFLVGIGRVSFIENFWKTEQYFIQALRDQCHKNKMSTDEMSKDLSVPLNYYAVFASLEKMMPKNAYVVSEGANTMDIGRTILANHLPRLIVCFISIFTTLTTSDSGIEKV